MSRISVVGIGAQLASVATSDTPALPKGIRQNDLLVMFIAAKPSGTAGTADTTTVNNSWTQHGSRRRREIGTDDLSVEVWYKIAGATETDPTVTVGTAWSGTEGYSMQIAAFRGVDTTTPFDATAVGSDAAAAATWAPTGITTVTNNAVAVSFVASADDNALNFNTSQNFAIIMGGANYDTTTGTDHAVGVAVKEITAAGAVTMPTWNESVLGNDAWAGLSLALRPDTTTWAFQETWMAAAGTAWNASNFSTVFATGGSTQDSNAAQGRIATSAVGGYSDFAYAEYTQPDDPEITVDFTTTTSAAAEQYHAIRWRTQLDGSTWAAQVGNGGGGFYIQVLRVAAGGGDTELYLDNASFGASFTTNDVLHIRVRVIENNIKLRYWVNNAAEPSTWQADINETMPASGKGMIGTFAGNAAASVNGTWRAFYVKSMPPAGAGNARYYYQHAVQRTATR